MLSVSIFRSLYACLLVNSVFLKKVYLFCAADAQ